MRLISLLLASLSLVSSMPIRPEPGQPVVHNHYNRIPNIPGLKGLKEQILVSIHRQGETPEEHQEHEMGKPGKTTPAPTITTTQPPVTTTAPPTNPPATSAPTATLFPTLAPDTTAPGSNGLPYNGGTVMTGAVKVYLVFYGSWQATDPAIPIVTTFVSNLGLSAWWNIQTSFYQPNPTTGVRSYVQQGITLGSYVIAPIDSTNGGTSLTDTNVNTIISNQIKSGKLPYDANGVYIMISSSEVFESGFCSSDCGWHSAAYVSGTSQIMKYGWVGDATVQCPSACTEFANTISPNGNKSADSVISILAHEIAESVSDPYLNAWVDTTNNYNENADKCAWNFLTTYTSANGGLANVNFGGHDYLVQSNWKNRDGGGCALHL
jgi:hypothetical protein